MSPAETIALAGLTLNVLVAVVGLTWGVARIRDAVRCEIEAHREKVDGELDALTRSFGKNLIELRDKIREVELYVRDTYLRRDNFYEVMKGVSADLRSNFDKIEARLERMEAKIDSRG
jgi:hypothetical protein